jgi:ABC-type Zn2+ transport system substrate-binding protein/surface adhesin
MARINIIQPFTALKTDDFVLWVARVFDAIISKLNPVLHICRAVHVKDLHSVKEMKFVSKFKK